jgi:hypothetical protein
MKIASLDTILQKVIEVFDIDDAMLTSLIQGAEPKAALDTSDLTAVLSNWRFVASEQWNMIGQRLVQLLVASAGGDVLVDASKTITADMITWNGRVDTMGKFSVVEQFTIHEP